MRQLLKLTKARTSYSMCDLQAVQGRSLLWICTRLNSNRRKLAGVSTCNSIHATMMQCEDKLTRCWAQASNNYVTPEQGISTCLETLGSKGSQISKTTRAIKFHRRALITKSPPLVMRSVFPTVTPDDSGFARNEIFLRHPLVLLIRVIRLTW